MTSSSHRFATIDIGTNSVLLLVAERSPEGRFHAVKERAEITRLGRGVDQNRLLSEAGMEDTLKVLSAFADEARSLGATSIAATATSAARDSKNGEQFLNAARERAGLTVEILSGAEEAQLSFSAVHSDFGAEGPLLVVDIGGGSTEFIYGLPSGEVAFRQSFDVGSVRLSERFLHSDPPSEEEIAATVAHLRSLFAALPPPSPGAQCIGVAGTVTTLFAVEQQLEPYDAAKVHGKSLGQESLQSLVSQLLQLPLNQRRQLRGLQPKRADVICAGGLILLEALRALKLDTCRVSDRGLRWGLLTQRFAGAPL